MTKKLKISKRKNREAIINYIEAQLARGYSKRAAYIEYIDSDAKIDSLSSLIVSFEKSKEFQEIHQVLSKDNGLMIQAKTIDIRRKFLGLVEKNIETANSLLENAEMKKDKAAAVRLANETVSAMAVISGENTSPNKGGQDPPDPSGVIS